MLMLRWARRRQSPPEPLREGGPHDEQPGAHQLHQWRHDQQYEEHGDLVHRRHAGEHPTADGGPRWQAQRHREEHRREYQDRGHEAQRPDGEA
eukprot:15320989-Heterocapsa_arctica.AAC.1